MEHHKKTKQEPWDDGVYGTGNTMPPKSHGGIIALLLTLVIFLCGIISFLSILNIKLVWKLNHPDPVQPSAPVSFSGRHTVGNEEMNLFQAEENTIPAGYPTLGLAGQTVSKFDQKYFRVPAGIYITQVSEASDAAAYGVTPGDILCSVEGVPVTSNEALIAVLADYAPGDRVTVEIYRNGAPETLELTVLEQSDSEGNSE